MTKGYGGDLKSQLIAFAARKVAGKLIDAASRETTKRISKSYNKTKHRKKKSTMAIQETSTARSTTRSAARSTSGDNQQEPTTHWVNVVMVTAAGAAPVRLMSGRPLQTFTANARTTTSSEELNEANAIANSFVSIMKDDADSMALGENRYYAPSGVSYDTDEETGEDIAVLEPGIYVQLYREKNDPEVAAAASMDIEAKAKADLRNLFGAKPTGS